MFADIGGQARRVYWLLRAVADDPAPYFKLWFTTIPWTFVVRFLRRPIYLDTDVQVPMGPFCSFWMALNLVSGAYERTERSLLREFLRDDDVVLELGTGIGAISTICAQRLGSHRVFTFEANPQLVPIAQQTFKMNGVAPTIENCILGASDGHKKFYIEKHFWSSTTVRPNRAAKEVLVPVRRLADAIAAIRPTFLIVDIEGGEAELFERVDLPGVARVLIELHPDVVGEESVSRVCRAFRDAAFTPTRQLSGGRQVLLERRFKT